MLIFPHEPSNLGLNNYTPFWYRCEKSWCHYETIIPSGPFCASLTAFLNSWIDRGTSLHASNAIITPISIFEEEVPMTIRFDGQVGIITGSGRGLGKAYAT